MAEPRDKLAGDTRVDAVRSIGADGAPSDEVRIRRMLPADIAQGMRLKQIAGWNQTRATGRAFYALEPSGCYVAERASLVVGTVTTCRFYSVAWIGMMLVDPAHRRRGIATHLMQHALDRLESAGAERIRLDATKMGVPLYRRLGFLPQLEIARYGGNPTRLTSRSRLPRVRDFQWTDWPALYELDREVSRVDRTKLLKRLLVQAGGTARVVSVEGRLQGFLLARPGSSAAQIGPFSHVAKQKAARCLPMPCNGIEGACWSTFPWRIHQPILPPGRPVCRSSECLYECVAAVHATS